mmetsp:Transcript_95918/g.241671  ORF Transcript_95918/g.241671 Transcript_95918/m.241671 type:complete len:141 (+) Transcript_95918:803-1225(+)
MRSRPSHWSTVAVGGAPNSACRVPISQSSVRRMRWRRGSRKIVCWMLASKGGPKSRRRHDIIGLALTCSRTFVTFEVPSLLTFDLAARQKVCTDDASWSFEAWEVVVAKNGMLAEASQRHRGDAAGNRPHDTPGHVLLLQ